MMIELTRRHAVLFSTLCGIQLAGLWITFERSPVLAGLPRSIWMVFFGMVPGSAFLTTLLIVKLLSVTSKHH